MDRFLFLLCAAVLLVTPAQGTDRPATERKASEEKAPLKPRAPRERENASAGATSERRGGTDLGYEAEKEEEAYLKKKRTAPLKGR